jgi:hypothetical protein
MVGVFPRKMGFARIGLIALAGFALGVLPKASFGMTSANLLLNSDASLGTGIDPGTVPDWIIGGDSNPGRDDGTFDGFIPPASKYSFYGGSGDTGSLSQVVDLISSTSGLTASGIDSGKDSFNVSFYEQSLEQGTPPNDEAEVLISFQNGDGVTIPGGYNSGQLSNIGGWEFIDPAAIDIPAGARDMTYEMLFTRQYGVDLDGFIASNDVTASTPGSTGTTGGSGPAGVVPLPAASSSGLALLSGVAIVGYFARRREVRSDR